MRLPSITSALLAACLLLPGLTATAQTTTGSTSSTTKPATAPPSKTKTAAKSSKADLTSVVNINTGTSTELGSLPQIGKVRTAKIIAGRPYKSVDELVTKKVLSQKLFDKLKARLTT